MAAIIHLLFATMPPRASSSKTAITAGILGGLLAAALGAYYVYNPPAGTPATQQAPGAQLDDKAVNALLALPEIRAWSAHIEKASGGRSHGAVMETAPEQRLVDGQAYFQLSFFENAPDAAHRWESFLVTPDGKRILVEDTAEGDLLSLERWRKESAPMKRVPN
jgi:hypothetical protein